MQCFLWLFLYYCCCRSEGRFRVRAPLRASSTFSTQHGSAYLRNSLAKMARSALIVTALPTGTVGYGTGTVRSTPYSEE
jgi:hypothetical protein